MYMYYVCRVCYYKHQDRIQLSKRNVLKEQKNESFPKVKFDEKKNRTHNLHIYKYVGKRLKKN
jgi:hypothetical protein